MPDLSTQQWKEWLQSIPKEQLPHLADALMGFEEADIEARTRPNTNGHSKTDATELSRRRIRIEREPTDELYIRDPPPYLDVLQLHEIYKRMAFHSNIVVKGPKGDGKTLSVVSFASQIQCPVVMVECSEDLKRYDLIGSQSLIGDETIFVLGAIPTAIDVANEVGKCILLFEEMNALTPQTQKMLNAATDFRKTCSVRQINKTYRLRKGALLWVVGTHNPAVYGGTYDTNEDLKSRFLEVEVTYLNKTQEKEVLKHSCGSIVDDATLDLLIRYAQDTRQQGTGYALSTRDLDTIVRSIPLLGLDCAIQLSLCKFEGEDRNTAIRRVASVFGSKNWKNFWGA